MVAPELTSTVSSALPASSLSLPKNRTRVCMADDCLLYREGHESWFSARNAPLLRHDTPTLPLCYQSLSFKNLLRSHASFGK